MEHLPGRASACKGRDGNLADRMALVDFLYGLDLCPMAAARRSRGLRAVGMRGHRLSNRAETAMFNARNTTRGGGVFLQAANTNLSRSLFSEN